MNKYITTCLSLRSQTFRAWSKTLSEVWISL